MIRANNLNESKFYRHWFMYRLNKLRHKSLVAKYHKEQADGVFVRHAAKQLLTFRANADALKVHGRFVR